MWKTMNSGAIADEKPDPETFHEQISKIEKEGKMLSMQFDTGSD